MILTWTIYFMLISNLDFLIFLFTVLSSSFEVEVPWFSAVVWNSEIGPKLLFQHTRWKLRTNMFLMPNLSGKLGEKSSRVILTSQYTIMQVRLYNFNQEIATYCLKYILYIETTPCVSGRHNIDLFILGAIINSKLKDVLKSTKTFFPFFHQLTSISFQN